MSIIESLPALPDQFRHAAQALPGRVRAALPSIVTAIQAADALAQAEAMRRYARQIKAQTDSVNAIAEATLLLKAKLGKLLPRQQGRGGGRGKKKLREGPSGSFPRVCDRTVSVYRKVADHADDIHEYAKKLTEANAAQPEDSLEPVEMSTTAFLRYVGSDRAICTKHGSGEMEWYTPGQYIEAARQVMGAIDLDRASCKAAQKAVKARRFFSLDDDGLAQPWSGRVFLNPPFHMPAIRRFVFRLCDFVESKAVSEAILLTNDNTDTTWWQRAAALSSAICFHSKRIAFYNSAGKWSAPTNGQTLFYFGPRTSVFVDAFSAFGLVLLTRFKD